MCAAEKGQTNAVSLLLERGADSTIEDNYGLTALNQAMKRGRKDTIALLTENTNN